MRSSGLCLGAATLGLVTVEKNGDNISIAEALTKPHEGNPRELLLQLLSQEEEMRLCATGRKFRYLLDLPSIAEPEAVELACQHVLGKIPADGPVDGVVSAGSETFILYELDEKGQVGSVHTGNKCASGSGEFFLQQIKRMGLTPAEALEASVGEEPYPVAGRCSVFCKSDCTHALNKGEQKERVVAGLCQMLYWKILELVRKTGCRRILLVGGVAKNRLVVDALRSELEVIVPPESSYFEALGAALWGLQHEIAPRRLGERQTLFHAHQSSFGYLPPLKKWENKVSFKEIKRSDASPGDRLLLGLDVGSTTTKAALIREEDRALVGSVYLYTRGDPVEAARSCYRELAKQVPEGVQITVLGVTGSGRQIAALHALTPAVINEIIAHATAALYFDPSVETIFEIGGQDAKYTHIINGVPVDYAMNEACSAGTGSFLEEAAGESLEVEMTQIAPLARQSSAPPNFNDQCSAFISSDIKTAVQEGIKKEDILAGLVYSICQNYLTRVKGSRPEGRKIFMQGGVCYNHAIPVAMVSLLEREIVVPPEPGLMGAFGVALSAEEKLKRGLMDEGSYSLEELAEREMIEEEPFTCRGNESCERKCLIRMLRVNGKRRPFGGACSRYSIQQKEAGMQSRGLDLVWKREQLVLQQPPLEQERALRARQKKKIGITRSLMVHTFYPLYYHFFTSLGHEVVTASRVEPWGKSVQGASFCFPVELAHGYMAELLEHEPDHIFLPQVSNLQCGDSEDEKGITCPLLQGEPYYLKATFPALRQEGLLLAPVLDFSGGYRAQEENFVRLGRDLGATRKEARRAFRCAVERQEEAMAEMKQWGQKVLAELDENPDKKAVVVFGRSYNAFNLQANLGIPHKFASRGWTILPCDFLPYEEEEPFEKMYWGAGQIILRAASLVRKHPQLFGVYITNFSCGPDSFLLGYFREIMGNKPSLTLELDEHTADAGLDTRVEAFLDIVGGYLENPPEKVPDRARSGLEMAAGLKGSGNHRRSRTVVEDKWAYVETPEGERLPLNHPRVKLLMPAMGEQGTRLISRILNGQGIHAEFLPSPGEREIRLARAHVTSKECLPLLLTVGSLLRYVEDNGSPPDEQLVYFMPDASGPCRFGQYSVFINRMADRLEMKNVSTLSLSSENSYGGMGTGLVLRTWMAFVIADVMHEIYNSILVAAQDPAEGNKIYEKAFEHISGALYKGTLLEIRSALQEAARMLAGIKKTGNLEDFPRVTLVGEIYVRHDRFSCRDVVDYLTQQGIITRVAPIHEWIYYCDYLLQRGITGSSPTQRFTNRLQGPIKSFVEREIKKILSLSGLCSYHPINMEKLLSAVEDLISTRLTGEAILTVSTTLQEVVDDAEGAIAIGPFGCMPNRIAEAIAGKTLEEKKRDAADDRALVQRVLSRQPSLPFMAVETDGSVFPQVLQARLESFALQVKRLHRIMQEEKSHDPIGFRPSPPKNKKNRSR